MPRYFLREELGDDFTQMWRAQRDPEIEREDS